MSRNPREGTGWNTTQYQLSLNRLSRNPREGPGGKINHDCSLFRLLVVACANNIAQTPTVLQAYRKEKLKNRFVSLFRQVRTHLFARERSSFSWGLHLCYFGALGVEGIR